MVSMDRRFEMTTTTTTVMTRKVRVRVVRWASQSQRGMSEVSEVSVRPRTMPNETTAAWGLGAAPLDQGGTAAGLPPIVIGVVVLYLELTSAYIQIVPF